MATLNTYFTNNIGRTIRNAVTTGRTFYTEVYERAYAAEVIAFANNHVTVHLTSHDNTPSGYALGGSEQRLGDYVIDIAGCAGLTDFWQRLIPTADPAFAAKYGASTLKRNN